MFILLFAPLLARAEEVLDNDAVVRMVRAGLASEIIVMKVERTAGHYDLSTDALIALKTAGASDAVLKAMLVKAPSLPAPSVRPAPASESCADLRYFTTGNGGWSWTPASVCVTRDAVVIDEQRVALPKLTAQCRVKGLALFGADDGEWWLSDGTDTYKFRGIARELDAVEAAVLRAAPSVPHGSCSDRAVRRLLAAGR